MHAHELATSPGRTSWPSSLTGGRQPRTRLGTASHSRRSPRAPGRVGHARTEACAAPPGGSLRIFSGCAQAARAVEGYTIAMRLPLLAALLVVTQTPPTDGGVAEVHDQHEHPLHFSSQAGITFVAAIGGASERPAVRGARDRAQIHRRGAEDLPRVSAGPQLTIQPGARVAPADGRAFAIQGQITQSWNLADLGARRRESEAAASEVTRAEARRRDLEARLEAAHCWIALRGVERSLDIARQELELASALRSTMKSAVDAGEGTASDLMEVDVHLATVDAHVVELEGMAHDLGLELAVASGAPPGAPLTTAGADPEPALGDLDDHRAQLDRVDVLPAVEVARLRQLEARAQRAETRAVTAPTLTTGVSAQREGRDDAVVYGVIGIGFGNSPGRRRATLGSDLSDRKAVAQLEEARRAAKADLTQALHEVEHTDILVRRLETRRLPAQGQLVEVRRARRELGEGTMAEEMWARHALLVTRQDLAVARTKRTWARVRAWVLVAQLLGEDAP